MRDAKAGIWFWSPTLTRLSPEARLVYLWSETAAVWPGVLDRCEAAAVRSGAFPTDEDLPLGTVDGWIAELVRAGLWVRYSPEGALFADAMLVWLPLLLEHQDDEPPPPSPLPGPDQQTVAWWERRFGRKPSTARQTQREKRVTSRRELAAQEVVRLQAARPDLPALAIDQAGLLRLVDVALGSRSPVRFAEAVGVFLAWVRDHGVNPAVARPTPDRLKKVMDRLDEGFTVEQLEVAVRGILKSDWHTGTNPGGKRYTDLYNVCKEGRHVERFIALEQGAEGGTTAWESEIEAEQAARRTIPPARERGPSRPPRIVAPPRRRVD